MVVDLWKYWEITHNDVGNIKVASLSDDKMPSLKDEGLDGGC